MVMLLFFISLFCQDKKTNTSFETYVSRRELVESDGGPSEDCDARKSVSGQSELGAGWITVRAVQTSCSRDSAAFENPENDFNTKLALN